MEHNCEHEIVLGNLEDALQMVGLLSKQNYVAMLSKEGPLFVINYEWAKDGDRNEIVFMHKDWFEENFRSRSTEEAF